MKTNELTTTYERNDAEIRKALSVSGPRRSVETYLEIPDGAHGPTANEATHTHVRVCTDKGRNNHVSCDSRSLKREWVEHPGMEKGGYYSEQHLLFGSDKFQSYDLATEETRATQAALLRVHRAGLTALKAKYPELFAAPAEVSTQGAESAPEASEDRVERGEADATGVDDEEDASTGRWTPPTMRTTVLSSANVRGLFTMLALALGLGAFAQNVTRDAQGNFHSNRIVEAAHDSTTGYTYTYQHGPKEYTLPVFVTAKGAYYAWRLSGKTGKQYRYYLRTEAGK